jgi:hypothetical protein
VRWSCPKSVDYPYFLIYTSVAPPCLSSSTSAAHKKMATDPPPPSNDRDDHYNLPDPPEDEDHYSTDSSGYDSPHEYERGDIRNIAPGKAARFVYPPSSVWRSQYSDNQSLESYTSSFDVEDQMHVEINRVPLTRRTNPLFKCFIGVAMLCIIVVGSIFLKNKFRIEQMSPSTIPTDFIQGSDVIEKNSTSETPQDVNVDLAAAATPTTTTTPYVPKNEAGEVDLGEWCGHCAGGPPGVTCDARVSYFGTHYHTPELEAKISLMEEGRCHKPTAAENAATRPVYPCRKTPEDQGGEEGAENFCGYCQWEKTQFDCWTRLDYLINTYHLIEITAKQGIIETNECVLPGNYTEQFNKDKENGVEEWCGGCSWGPHKCAQKLEWYLQSGEKTEVATKKEILAAGDCKKQPRCGADRI